MAYIQVIPVNVNDDIETSVTMSPYINLLAAVFEQARDDWQKGWKKVSKIGEYYDEEMYRRDRKYVKTLDKSGVEFIQISRKINTYESANKDISSVQIFLRSPWLELICLSCNLDSDAIRDEFEMVKNNILNNK